METGDYHERFSVWFQEQLKNLKQPSVIVMDNAPYHSVIIDKAPTRATRKAEAVQWLLSHKVQVDPSMKKCESMQLVQQRKPQFPTYAIDQLAERNGHRALRLPPYHCEFNPIELIWSQVKGYVVRNN